MGDVSPWVLVNAVARNCAPQLIAFESEFSIRILLSSTDANSIDT